MKSRKKKKRKLKLSFWKAVFLLFAALAIYTIRNFNVYMQPRLEALAKQHVSFAINNIEKQVLKNLEYDPDTFILPSYDEKGNIISISYDSYQLNQILYSALNTIDDSLLAAQDGREDPITHEVFYENGIFYRIPVGALTGIPFLANFGPSIPVKMQLLNDVTGRINITSEAYGINNTMIKISLVISVNAQVVTVLNVSEIQLETEIPIVMHLVNGKVPSILPYDAMEGT